MILDRPITRTIDKSKRVKVYRNLKHGRKSRPLYSVQQGGKVVARLHEIELRDAKFVVNEAGRQRVLREKRKNVHAFVTGYFVSEFAPDTLGEPLPVTYNPYQGPMFMLHGYIPIESADSVRINSNGISVITEEVF